MSYSNSKKRKTQPIELYDDCYRILMAFKEHLRITGHNVRGENNHFESQLIVAVNSHWANMNSQSTVVVPNQVQPQYQPPTQPEVYIPIPQQIQPQLQYQSVNSDTLTHEIRTMVLQEIHDLGKSLYSEIRSIKASLASNTAIHTTNTTKTNNDAQLPINIDTSQITQLTQLTQPISKFHNITFNTLFAEQFNGISVTDYHEVVNNGLSHDTNDIFYQPIPSKTNPIPDKPTYVMQQFIENYNIEFRNVTLKYIQNKNLVSQLSIDDNKLLNYIRTRYQRLGDMDTYTRLTTVIQSDLTLCELTELLEPLTEHNFTITKLSGETKYPPMSNPSRFKAAFNTEFDSCWKNDITEFTSI